MPIAGGWHHPIGKESKTFKCGESEFNTVIYSCINSWLSVLGCDKSGTASHPPKKPLPPLSCFYWGAFLFVEIEMEAETGKILNYCKEYNCNKTIGISV